MFTKKSLEIIFEYAPVAFAITHVATAKYISVNNAFCEAMGFSKEEVIGKSSIDLNTWRNPDDRKKIIEEIKKRGYVQNYKCDFITKTGEIKTGIISSVIVEIDNEHYLLSITEDITEFKKTEEKLEEKEYFLKTIFNNAKEGILLADVETKKFAFANPTICKILGYNKNEILNLTVYDIHPKDSIDYVLSEFEKQARGEKTLSSNVPCLRKDGKIIYADICTGKIKVKGRDYNLGLFTDVTERKISEEKLREKEKQLSTILKAIGDAVIAVDKDGKVTFINSVAEKLTGWSFEDAEGKNLGEVFKIINAKTRKIIENPVAKVFEKGKVIGLANDTILISKNGKEYNIADSAAPIKDYNGNIEGVVLIFRDISEKYRKEKELKETKDFLQAVFNSIQDGISVLNNDLTIRYVNPVMEKWYSMSLPLEGKKCFKAYHNKNEHCNPCPTIRCMQSRKTEMNIVSGHPDESTKSKVLELYAYPIIDSETGQIDGVVEFVKDITERVLAEKERAKFNKLDSLGILAGGIAHDFNNILTGIFGNIEIAKLKIDKNHPSYKFLLNAEMALNRAKSLSNQLLTFSKGGEPILENFNLKSIIEDVVTFNLTGSNVKPVFKLYDNLWNIKADKEQISQVIANLTINAKQAMPSGGNLYVFAENRDVIEIPGEKIEGKFVQLTIKDEGIGIPSEYLDKIFDPFFTTKQSGSGLGLAIVFSIVKKHNGYIKATSIPGKGTTFEIFLPADIDLNIKDNKISFDKTKETQKKDIKVLLMEDEVMVKDVAKEMLESLGCIVELTSDGKETFEKYKRAMESGRNFDIVIMDLTIPGGIGGEAAAKMILDIDKNAKIVVASGYSNSPILANFKSYGFSGRLTKPFKIKELEKIIKELLLDK